MLLEAFRDDPLTHYFIPPCDNWEELVSKYFAFRLRFGIMYGEAYAISPKIEGLAAWFAPGKSDMTNFRMMRAGGMALSRDMGKDIISRMNIIGEYISKIRKQHVTVPHWHLFPIAVDPAYQGKGFGSALLRPMLDRIAGDGLPCYLETQNEKNRSLYEHFGFKVIHTDTIPGINMKHWGMLKPP
ncbi:MAG: N-acetyltransferase [Candidatus Thorarchaeota archaeon]|nr:MAG: N-acetyltransferase [Candidatus Thorarchaeota archaeon]